MNESETFGSLDWREDCLYWWGKVLVGECAHWCPDWDDLPIDTTCGEFKYCYCDFSLPDAERDA